MLPELPAVVRRDARRAARAGRAGRRRPRTSTRRRHIGLRPDAARLRHPDLRRRRAGARRRHRARARTRRARTRRIEHHDAPRRGRVRRRPARRARRVHAGDRARSRRAPRRRPRRRARARRLVRARRRAAARPARRRTPTQPSSSSQLWPEHFDLACEIGDADAGTRANYGASPGDAAIPEPYLYVGPVGRRAGAPGLLGRVPVRRRAHLRASCAAPAEAGAAGPAVLRATRCAAPRRG